MNSISFILLLVVSIGILAHVGMWAASYLKLRKGRNKREEVQRLAGKASEFQFRGFLPPISVLKPLAGTDGELRQNLISFIQQDYPEFELVFGVQKPTDPAIEVVRSLQEEFPHANIRLVMTTESQAGYNPKVNNLIGMIPHARFEHLVISDSNVRVDKDYLRVNIQSFASPVVGIVTNLIRAQGGGSAGSFFESLHMNTFVMGSVSLADSAADQTVVVGKSIFFRRTQMNQLGGLQRFANYLAEDYLMGRAYMKAGYEVRLSGYTINTITTNWSMEQFINRHTRWAQLRWNINRPAYVAELMTNFPFWSLVLFACTGFSMVGLALLATSWSVKVLGDMLQNRWLGRPIPALAFLASPVKDLIIAAIFPRPILSSKTQWRGTQLKVKKDSLLVAA